MSSEDSNVGRVRVRSNVVSSEDAWHLVPGDALAEYRSELLKDPNRPTPRQREEHLYYVPCSRCNRLFHRFMLEGCDQCPDGPSKQQLADARARFERAREAVERV